MTRSMPTRLRRIRLPTERTKASRRPANKLKNVAGTNKEQASLQELVWYGFTEDMLAAKQNALSYFAAHRAHGDWLHITPLMAMTYFKRAA